VEKAMQHHLHWLLYVYKTQLFLNSRGQRHQHARVMLWGLRIFVIVVVVFPQEHYCFQLSHNP